MLLVDGTRESATFEKKSKRCEPVFDYIKTFAALLLIHPEFSETLLIGGAGCSLPKYLLMRFPEKRMEVVEKDALMVELANRYFYLEDAVQRYDPHRERLSVTVMDGYDYLCQIERRYERDVCDEPGGRAGRNRKKAAGDTTEKVFPHGSGATFGAGQAKDGETEYHCKRLE